MNFTAEVKIWPSDYAPAATMLRQLCVAEQMRDEPLNEPE